MAEKHVNIEDLVYDDHNFNQHTDEGMELLEKSITENKFGRSILIDKDNRIIAGNGIVEAATKTGTKKIRVIETDGDELIAVKRKDLSLDSTEGRRLALADNATSAANLKWDEKELKNAEKEWGVSLDDWSVPACSWEGEKYNRGNRSLEERFIVPPYSIFDTRKGYWQKRKSQWRELIGDNGESRSETLQTSSSMNYKHLYQRSMKRRAELGITFDEYLEKYVPQHVKDREASKVFTNGVSVLDPVLAEIICRWFGLCKCKTFDCFAGDSVFGYVSSYLGNEFTGIELREEQVLINQERVKGFNASYICDDGRNVADRIAPDSQDLLFSCPPYFNLEKYSELPNDASNQKDYESFIAILDEAFKNAVKCLKDNRFAVIVVGDIRDRRNGVYYDFCGSIKRIFKEAGLSLYNEIILIEQSATSHLRAAKCIETRKVVKVHQNVLVFYKGDTADIKEHFKPIEYGSEDLEFFKLDNGD